MAHGVDLVPQNLVDAYEMKKWKTNFRRYIWL